MGITYNYYENSKLENEIPFSEDKNNGLEKEYYDNGVLKSETIYTNGKTGLTKKYDESGREINN